MTEQGIDRGEPRRVVIAAQTSMKAQFWDRVLMLLGAPMNLRVVLVIEPDRTVNLVVSERWDGDVDTLPPLDHGKESARA